MDKEQYYKLAGKTITKEEFYPMIDKILVRDYEKDKIEANNSHTLLFNYCINSTF